MSYLRILACVCLAIVSNQSFAIYCDNLDRKSAAYQTCMLRQENEYRDIKAEIEKEKRASNQQAELRVAKREQVILKGGNLLAMADMAEASVSGECKGFQEASNYYLLFFCENETIHIFAPNSSPVVREILGDIEGKSIESMYVNGITILTKPKNFKIIRDGKAMGIVFDLKGMKNSFYEIGEMLKKDVPMEILIKTERNSARLVAQIIR